jgi:hypothetical protein
MAFSVIFLLMIIFLVATSRSVEAYIGPGAGIAAIGTFLAIIGGILLALVSFLWYPIKRLLARLRQKRASDREEPPS